jgi:methylation protein EvaC
MAAHFQAFASAVASRVRATRQPDPLVVEIGSNDGTMLQHFKGAGIRCLGVEPSTNVAAAARQRGLDMIDAFFSRALAADIRARSGPAAAIVAANVICHIPDFHDLAAGLRELLAPDGVLMFEDPYLGDMIEKRAYDQIYDEHVFMWSATSVSGAVARHGLELIDVQPQTTHGGSMRYLCGRAGEHPVSPAVGALLDKEHRAGLSDPATYDQFRRACETSRHRLRELLASLRDRGKRIAGYAATSKSTTVLNYCGIDGALIEFIADTTPIKQGKLTPGTHIPIVADDVFAAAAPDYAVLFAWNHAAEIFAKERAFTTRGGKWITFIPTPAILD